MRRTIGALTLALLACTAARADCGAAQEVWSIMDGPMEVRAYKGPEVLTTGPYFFEGRLDGSLVWRVTGEYACSNGIVRCSVQVPMSSGDPISAPETVVEDDGEPRYVVFADLSQSTAWVRFHSVDPVTVKADVFDVRALASLGDNAEVRLPNYLKFVGCSKGGGEFNPLPERRAESAPAGVPAPSPRPVESPGPFDGLWHTVGQVCMADDDRRPVSITGSKLEFYESDCEIGKASVEGTTKASMSCEGEEEKWGMSLELAGDGQRLLIAYDGDAAREYLRCPAP